MRTSGARELATRHSDSPPVISAAVVGKRVGNTAIPPGTATPQKRSLPFSARTIFTAILSSLGVRAALSGKFSGKFVSVARRLLCAPRGVRRRAADSAKNRAHDIRNCLGSDPAETEVFCGLYRDRG